MFSLLNHITTVPICALFQLCRWRLLNESWNQASDDLFLKTKCYLPKYTIDYLFLRKKNSNSVGNYISSLADVFPHELFDLYYSLHLTHAAACDRCISSNTIYHIQIFNPSSPCFTGFSVNASSERLNMGEIETLEDYWACANQLAFPASVNHGFSVLDTVLSTMRSSSPCSESQNQSSQAASSSPSKPFLPRTAQASFLRSASSWVDFVQSPGRVGDRIRSQQGWFGQRAFTVLWFLLLTYLEKKKINWDSANHCFPLLVNLTTSNTCSQGEREFVVNRCWSKPKCHTDTDFRAPSGQEVLSQARSCIHKLTLELATAGEGRWRAQFSLGWFEVAHPLPALLSTLFLEGKARVCLH